MTVLHFIDSGGLYGAESVLLNLSGFMASSGRYEPIVGCIVFHPDEKNDLYDKAVELGISAVKIVIRNTMVPFDIIRAARQLKGLGVDLIHSHGYKPSVFGYGIKLLTGIEVMSTCHLWFKGEKGPLKMRFMVALELMLYKSFKVVVGVSEPIREVLQEAGVSPQKLRVIKNGVDVGESLKTDPEIIAGLRREFRLGENDYCVLNTGRLTKQKAQCDIVSAAAIVRGQEKQVRFLIVGEGALKDDLLRQIEETNLKESVELVGFRDDITGILQMADLFILPSLDEGMPMSLLEAGAVGLPIVTTGVGDIPKLIEDKVTGLVVQPGDPAALAKAIIMQMENPELGAKMGAEVQVQVVQEYSTEAMFAQYDEVYSGLVGKP